MRSFRGIALVLLLALAGAPAGGTMCALVCAAPTPADSHHATQSCERGAHSSPGPRIDGVSEHDCRGQEASIGQAAVTTSERPHAIAKSELLATETIERKFATLDRAGGTFDQAPPGSAPPTTRPSVLRI